MKSIVPILLLAAGICLASFVETGIHVEDAAATVSESTVVATPLAEVMRDVLAEERAMCNTCQTCVHQNCKLIETYLCGCFMAGEMSVCCYRNSQKNE